MKLDLEKDDEEDELIDELANEHIVHKKP